MHVKKGDTVIVVAGNDKGKTGSVTDVYKKKNQVLVEGVNIRWKHQKATQQHPQGERHQMEFPINASNVMLMDPKTKKRTRKRPGTEK